MVEREKKMEKSDKDGQRDRISLRGWEGRGERREGTAGRGGGADRLLGRN